MWGIFRKPLERAIWNTLGLHAVRTTCLRFSSILDGVCVLLVASFCQQAANNIFCTLPRVTLPNLQDPVLALFQNLTQKPVLIKDDKIKWLDFGQTPDPENLEPHPGFVWVKSGYSEAIAWRRVQLTKQRNVDLTTDGLWAMPLNTGWVPIKARRLQDWEKLKKCVPIHKHGDVCPNGVPALVDNDNDSDSK